MVTSPIWKLAYLIQASLLHDLTYVIQNLRGYCILVPKIQVVYTLIKTTEYNLSYFVFFYIHIITRNFLHAHHKHLKKKHTHNFKNTKVRNFLLVYDFQPPQSCKNFHADETYARSSLSISNLAMSSSSKFIHASIPFPDLVSKNVTRFL